MISFIFVKQVDELEFHNVIRGVECLVLLDNLIISMLWVCIHSFQFNGVEACLFACLEHHVRRNVEYLIRCTFVIFFDVESECVELIWLLLVAADPEANLREQ